ncbi:MAG: efflux RND transporter periplasmic adaptor subunit [Deltaproteobacteria bacterium]|nr:efflux RND transporter periplasmic adaptor subunit [Deltaproteobacteria bacterium]
MKKIVITVIALLTLGAFFYSLGIGPFKEELAKGQQRGGRRRGGKTISVKVAKVKIGEVVEKLSFVGSLMANASVTVAPKIAGRVEKLFVRVGDLVKEGQLVARLEKDELAEDLKEAEASLNVYKATLKGKEAELSDLKRKLDRYKTLFEKNFIAREEVDTVETGALTAAAQVELTKAQVAQMKARLDNARIRLKYSEVISPFAGYVGKRFVDRGALVNSSSPLVMIVDLSRVKVIVPVVEKDYRKISIGQLSSITVDAYPGRRFEGKVARMAPLLNPETRTGEVEIELANPGAVLKPGMFARVEVGVQSRRGVLLVPEGAQVKTARGYGLFKVQGSEPRAKLIAIKTGLRHKGWVEVEGPLKPGDQVVTLGSNLLRDGQRIRLVQRDGFATDGLGKGE